VSLMIDLDRVEGVLLDAWYEVAEESFTIDSYEYVWTPTPRRITDFVVAHGGGDDGVCAAGFAFKIASEQWIAGPLTAIRAVRYTHVMKGEEATT